MKVSTFVEPEEIDFPFVDDKGRPLKSRRENTITLLAEHGARVRYNMMLHTLEVEFSGLDIAEERAGNASLAWLRYLARKHGLSANNVCEDIETIADEYHPALEWIDRCSWDGIKRLDALAATVDTSDEMAPTLIKTWVLQCAAALTSPPGFRPEGVLTFQGPQGCGKTQWVRMLVPESAGSGLVQIGRSLDPSNRDSVEQATSCWICELGEVDATFKRADIAALKAFLDLDYDRFRAAYARVAERRPRRTVFYASVNRPDFLADRTGNRRWWAVKVRACNWRHALPMRQVWAEAVAMVRLDPECWRLTAGDRDRLEESNARFEVISPLAQELWSKYEPDEQRASFFTLAEVCEGIGISTSSAQYSRAARDIAQLMSGAGVVRSRKRTSSGRVVMYAVRPL